MAKKKTNDKKFAALFALLFALSLAFLYQQYDYKLNKLASEEMFGQLEEGFSIFPAYTTVNLENEGSIHFHVAAVPGQEIDSLAGVKNHDGYEHIFKLRDEGFSLSVEAGDEETKAEVLPYLDLVQPEFVVSGSDVGFVPYRIMVPDDIEPGKYVGIISLEAIDDNGKDVNVGGAQLSVAVAHKIFVYVPADGEEPEAFEYVDISQLMEENAMNHVVYVARWMVAGVFFIMFAYFGYSAVSKK